MKVLIINGSPRMNGNTTIAVNEMVKVFEGVIENAGRNEWLSTGCTKEDISK